MIPQSAVFVLYHKLWYQIRLVHINFATNVGKHGYKQTFVVRIVELVSDKAI